MACVLNLLWALFTRCFSHLTIYSLFRISSPDIHIFSHPSPLGLVHVGLMFWEDRRQPRRETVRYWYCIYSWFLALAGSVTGSSTSKYTCGRHHVVSVVGFDGNTRTGNTKKLTTDRELSSYSITSRKNRNVEKFAGASAGASNQW